MLKRQCLRCRPTCVKHLNPRQGITTLHLLLHAQAQTCICWCETPKSPPGDYNTHRLRLSSGRWVLFRVKHLNPRQGITTEEGMGCTRLHEGPECETPKSPPGDYNTTVYAHCYGEAELVSVKHLNPRQGITTLSTRRTPSRCAMSAGVKHLNPRQGITTHSAGAHYRKRQCRCETPKSPPGDYNSSGAFRRSARADGCVKHLNPRQGITTLRVHRQSQVLHR